MKLNKYIGISMLSAGLVLAAASCTDYSDYNTAPVDGLTPGANTTLWENISNDPQLTKFTALAKKCNFSEALNSPRFYTVWAPVDAAFSDDDYNRLMASDSATVLKQFIQHHITEFNYPVSAALDSMTIVSLNSKHHPFTMDDFDGFRYAAINLPSSNGLMHKINGMSEFYNNLYENVDDLTDCDHIKAYIQKYDQYFLDPSASVIGPLVDGKQTYLDSVLRKTNNVVRSIMNADLENEDSTYCMLIPNDKAWEAAYEAIRPCYNYISTMDYMDVTKKTQVASNATSTTAKAEKPATLPTSMSRDEYNDSLTYHNIVSRLVFSRSYQRNSPLFGEGIFAEDDSAYATSRRYLTNMPEVLEHTTDVSEMSNGIARVVDSLAFFPWETYNPVISVKAPDNTLKVAKLTTHSIYAKTGRLQDFPIFSKVPEMFKQWLFPANSPYFTYVAVDSTDVEGSSGKPEFNFALRGVRSTTYHIYVVTVPAQIEEDADHLVRPYYLRFYLSWTDASNKQQYTVLPQGARNDSEISTDFGENTNKLTFVGDPDKVNVLDLGEFTFPACYYGLDAYPSLMMMHTKSYASASNRSKYDQQMRVAGVYLVPKEYNDKWSNSANE